MELELKKEQFACYQALPQLSENREETTETIVPDYLPDIARIVDASGCLFLRSREIADGKAQVSGTVRMTLLYVAEDAQGMKSFEYTLPLDETIEGRALSGSADSCLDGRLCSCEVRMLNPRKVFTRVNVELTLTPYVPASLSVCSGVKEQEAYKIETLCEKKDIGIIRAIREKDFTFSDEVLLSGTKEPIQELLRTKCALRVTDCKSIGNKIVLKGVARLDAIYLDESGNLAPMSSELPFSQILDGLAEEEGETTVRASLRATANLRVLYLDENAVPLLSERRSEVLLETDLPADGQARVQDMYAGEIAASVGADGVELRFPVTFAVSVAETPCYPCLQSLEAEECGKKDENVPSLVLRAMKQGERLWDIAKLYRTTVEAILAANELKEESAAVIGKLLLIPRRR